MKKLLIPFIAVVLMAASCGDNRAVSNPGSDKKNEINPTDAASIAAAMAQIDTMAFIVDQAVNHTNMERYYPYIYSKKDGVFLYRENGEIKRLTCALYEKNVESRSFYYVKGGEVVFHRRREWHFNDDPPYAKEFIGYMKNGGVINAQERKIILSPGEKPGALMSESFNPVNLDMDSLHKKVSSDYLFLKATTDTCKIKIIPQ